MFHIRLPLCSKSELSILLALAFGFWAVTAWSAAPEPERTVDIALTEYQIDMPTTLEPGWTSLRISNMGKKDHSFKIKGPDLEKKLESELKPGQSATLQVDLKPGTYRVSCPKDDHDDDKDMKLKLRVSRH
jgi:hypothetical protein